MIYVKSKCRWSQSGVPFLTFIEDLICTCSLKVVFLIFSSFLGGQPYNIQRHWISGLRSWTCYKFHVFPLIILANNSEERMWAAGIASLLYLQFSIQRSFLFKSRSAVGGFSRGAHLWVRNKMIWQNPNSQGRSSCLQDSFLNVFMVGVSFKVSLEGS